MITVQSSERRTTECTFVCSLLPGDSHERNISELERPCVFTLLEGHEIIVSKELFFVSEKFFFRLILKQVIEFSDARYYHCCESLLSPNARLQYFTFILYSLQIFL